MNFSNELKLKRENSIYTNLTHRPDSDKNWIQLQISDLRHDAGQSMLPLFHGAAVEAMSIVTGIGLVHKGVEDYAGFITPQLFPFAYQKYLSNFINSTGFRNGFGDSGASVPIPTLRPRRESPVNVWVPITTTPTISKRKTIRKRKPLSKHQMMLEKMHG